ncbi:putative glycosyltransferase [Forsythia ovata]|uniref:Glycosyltransferase n=1 Tax=Forsythia ovata TaxID=205694 RepID=A0ABD1T8T6_9LAMI
MTLANSSQPGSSNHSTVQPSVNLVVLNEESVTSTGLRKKYSNLERIEAGLAQARATISEARKKNEMLDDPDYVPRGPLYLNANVFHSVLSIVGYVYIVDSRLWGPMQNTARDYVNLIAGRYPYWNRSLGHDHFMLACHDWGPKISSAVRYLRKNSIRVLCNANTSEKFHPIKDVSMPEIYLPQGTMDGLIGGPSPSKRSILVFFAGGIHGYIRQVLMEHWENKDSDVQIHEYLPKNMSYYGMVRQSKYCICPSGWEVASPRMVEALYMGCVPVLIKDNYAKPFGDVLNWSTFSVDVAVKDIPNLKTILMSIPQRQYLKMQRIGIQARRHFEKFWDGEFGNSQKPECSNSTSDGRKVLWSLPTPWNSSVVLMRYIID